MPHIRYPDVITVSVDELVALERSLRGERTQPRVTMRRLLKTGQACSLVAVAPMLGYGVRTVNTWWKRYQSDGLHGLLEQRPRPGNRSQVTEAAWADLAAAMTRGEIATRTDAQRFLAEQHDIHYQSLGGVWWLLRQRTVRLKTGRRRHRQADPAAQTAYKGTFGPTLRAERWQAAWAMDEGRVGLKV
jgi:transposase